jgi:Leucine-rich repeat (LRR) protein
MKMKFFYLLAVLLGLKIIVFWGESVVAQNRPKQGRLQTNWEERVYFRVIASPAFLDSVQRLDLSLQERFFLDTLVKHCRQLRVLNLNDNNIKKLGPLPQSAKLNALLARNNLISHFEPFICSLTELRELDLSGNKITYLPDCICNLTSLWAVNLNKNPLGQIPSCFPGKNPIQRLELSGCQLKSINPLIFCNKTLEQLDISKNFLQSLPDTIISHSSLKELNLSNNYLKQIPPLLYRLPNLEILNLSNNKLVNVSELAKAPKLKTLILRGNKSLTKEKIKELKTLLPKVKIIY